MSFRRVLLSAMLPLGLSLSAYGQAAVYGTFTAERVTSIPCTFERCSSTDGGDNLIGGGGGIYYDFMQYRRFHIGADVRGNVQRSNKSASTPVAGSGANRMDEALGGVRMSTDFRKQFLHPYAEVAVGWNRRDNAAGYGENNFLAYRGMVGLDVSVLPVMDVRVPEVGFGQNIGFSGNANNTVTSVSVGVVFHMPR